MGLLDYIKQNKDSKEENINNSPNFDKIMEPFFMLGTCFHDSELEKAREEALKKVMSYGIDGEKYLLDFILQNVNMNDGYFSPQIDGEYAHDDWVKKTMIVSVLADATDDEVITKLSEIVFYESKITQFYELFQPRIVETLSKLKRFDVLEKFVNSGQTVGAVLLAKDILRLYDNGESDKVYNIRDENGFTPLQNAVEDNDRNKVIQLINDGADINQISSRGTSLGQTALYYAVVNNNLDIVEILLSNNADPDLSDRYGSFPLQRAAAIGLTEMVKLLVKFGANKNQKTSSGKTALIWAEQNSHEDIVNVLKNN